MFHEENPSVDKDIIMAKATAISELLKRVEKK